MTKANDVYHGRRGGHEVPAGVEPGHGLDDIEQLRAAAKAAGTWPADDRGEPVECDGQLGLFGGDGA